MRNNLLFNLTRPRPVKPLEVFLAVLGTAGLLTACQPAQSTESDASASDDFTSLISDALLSSQIESETELSATESSFFETEESSGGGFGENRQQYYEQTPWFDTAVYNPVNTFTAMDNDWYYAMDFYGIWRYPRNTGTDSMPELFQAVQNGQYLAGYGGWLYYTDGQTLYAVQTMDGGSGVRTLLTLGAGELFGGLQRRNDQLYVTVSQKDGSAVKVSSYSLSDTFGFALLESETIAPMADGRFYTIVQDSGQNRRQLFRFEKSGGSGDAVLDLKEQDACMILSGGICTLSEGKVVFYNNAGSANEDPVRLELKLEDPVTGFLNWDAKSLYATIERDGRLLPVQIPLPTGENRENAEKDDVVLLEDVSLDYGFDVLDGWIFFTRDGHVQRVPAP